MQLGEAEAKLQSVHLMDWGKSSLKDELLDNTDMDMTQMDFDSWIQATEVRLSN